MGLFCFVSWFLATKDFSTGYKYITEGSATILFPENNDVFYNKVGVMPSIFLCVGSGEEPRSLHSDDYSFRRTAERGDGESEGKEAFPLRGYHGGAQACCWGGEYVLLGLNSLTFLDKPWIAEDGLYILEALAASGLRSIRYFNEIPNIRRIIINDIADAAVESMKDNLAYNKITSDRVVPNQA